MNKKLGFAGIMGIIFIGVGVVSFAVIGSMFDYTTYNDIKDLTLTYGEEHTMMTSELKSLWTLATTSLIVNTAIGSLLLAVDKAVNILNKIEGKLNGR